jgi:ABC-type transport system involved in cytochrome c biogenesis ATPase subunit
MVEHCANGGMIVLTSHHDIDLHEVNVLRINLSNLRLERETKNVVPA